jgi:uncharacterized phage protein gp47/JayE
VADIPEVEILNLLNYGDEPALVSAALARMRNSLPEWEPREGSTELALIEGLAVMLGPLIMATQMAPKEMLIHLMTLYGVTRNPGYPASVMIDILTSPTVGEKIVPRGTRFRLQLDDAGNTVDLLTDDQITISPEDLKGWVRARAETPGAEMNGTAPGSVLDTIDPLPFIESVITQGVVTPGAGQEDLDAFMRRSGTILARQTSVLVLPEHFQYAAAEQVDVGRALVLNNYNPTDGSAVGATLGHVAVAVADTIGNPLPVERMTEIRNSMDTKALASLAIHVITPAYTQADFPITVRKTASATDTEVAVSVDSAIREAFGPLAWTWGTTISPYMIVAVVSRAYGVDEVISVPSAIALPGVAPLAIIRSVDVTVQ